MKWINHVNIIQISSSGFVSQVHRMLERKIPDRKRLELGIAGVNAAFVFVIELTETGGKLAAARAGSGDHYETTGGLNIFIAAKAIFRDNQ